MSIRHSHTNKPASSRSRYGLLLILFLISGGIGALYVHTVQEKKRLVRAQEVRQQFFLAHAEDFWSESEYLKYNPDVAQAIESGQFAENGWFHFLHFGLQEGRPGYLLPSDNAIHTETEAIFQQYLNQITRNAENEHDEILALMNWFSAIAIKGPFNTEVEMARRLRNPIRSLPLHEVIYLLKTNQYAMLCGNYAYFFARILKTADYHAVDYDTGHQDYQGATHVVTLVRCTQPSCMAESNCFTVWDSFYNYYIADQQEISVCLQHIYQAMDDFYSRGTSIPHQIIHGNRVQEKHLCYLPTFSGSLSDSFDTQEVSSDLPDPENFVFGFMPTNHDTYVDERLPYFTHPQMKNLSPLNLLPLPLGPRNQEIVQEWLTQYPNLSNQVLEYLDNHHSDLFIRRHAASQNRINQ